MVKKRACGVLDRRKPAAPGLRGPETVEERRGLKFAQVNVPSVLREHARLLKAVLVKLRVELDEVAKDRGARERLKEHIREHAGQVMAELCARGRGRRVGSAINKATWVLASQGRCAKTAKRFFYYA